MKHLFTLILLFAGLQLSAQTATCKDHHDGNFEVVVDGEVIATVVRTGNEQIEYSITDNSIIIYSVVWLNDCTQELRLKEVVQANDDQVYVTSEDVIKVEITDVDAKGYIVHITMKGSLMDIKGEMRVAEKK